MLGNRTAAYLTSRLAVAVARAATSCATVKQSAQPACRLFSSLNEASLLRARPIYSLRTCERNLANTTSGTFAPTNLDGLTRAKQSITLPGAQGEVGSNRGQLNIFDDSDHLPSLPVPNLNETLERLKETIWPIAMNSAEFAHALELIEAFSGSAGQKLDLLLRAKANQTKNWLTHDWWTQEAYLKSRVPLVINSNPAMIYPKLPFEVHDQRKLISTVAQLISGIIDFKLALLQGYNPEPRGQPSGGQMACGLNNDLCYNQYRHIFGSTRMPGEQMDSVQFKPLNDDLTDSDVARTSNKFNLIVSHLGQFFEIQLNNIDNEQDRNDTLVNVLSKIIDFTANASGQTNSALAGLGILTASRRDKWAQSIKLLDDDSLRSIREAHLVVCLDSVPSKPEDKFLEHLLEPESGSGYREALSRQILHSDRTNVGNRWFDKSLQLIVVTDEQAQRFLGAGINYEHSVAEAMVVTKLIEYSHKKVVEQKNLADKKLQASGEIVTRVSQVDHSTAARYRHLKMVDSQDETRVDELSELMVQARQDFVSQLGQFDLAYFNFQHYGSDSIKSWQFSPDSWFQVGLQLAHYQLHKRMGPCYESASTRQFAYGRTETIRSLTKDVAEFCQEPSLETMKSAIVSHKSYANAANNASAIDRVLLGYRLIFNELKANNWAWGLPTFDECQDSAEVGDGQGHAATNNRLRFHSLADTKRDQQVDLNDLFTERELNTLSAFFNNELIERSKKFALSTSQVSSVHPEICMSYGPLLADGYGCCYNISGQQIVAAITANSSNQSFSCEVNKFSESLSEALDKMRDIVVESHQQQRSKNQSAKNGLSNYKPASLMLEVNAANGGNIDTQLGVKNLVTSHALNKASNSITTTTTNTSSMPVAKSRQNLDHWSTNNGSVIYAQSEVVKNHLTQQQRFGNANDSNHSSGNSNDQREASSNHHGSGQHPTKYLKATTTTTTTATITTNTNGIPSGIENNRHAAVDGAQDYATIRPASRSITTRLASHPRDLDLAGDDENLSGEDLNSRIESSAKWSNGTGTTSDLLF